MSDAPSPGSKSVFARIWLVFFLHGMVPGFWFSILAIILNARQLGDWVALAYGVSPIAALISPLIGGALADNRVAADRLFAWLSLIGSVVLWATFACLDRGLPAWWFITLMFVYAVVMGPTWGLLTVISMSHLPKPERSFPLVRVGGTIGWMVGGLLTSKVLHADASPIAGYASAGVRVLCGLAAFSLPLTLPLGRSRSWKTLLGLDAFPLLKQRDHLVFYGVTALFSIPMTALYMYSSVHLRAFGDQHAASTMTIAQWSEIIAMFAVGAVMSRCRVKAVMAWALGLCALRYAFSAWSGATGLLGWHLLGISLHGVCYTFYFITAQVFLDRRVAPEQRGQAQGLLTLMAAGIGPLIGTWTCKWLYQGVVIDAAGWQWFWGILSAMVLVCLLLFVTGYQGQKPKPAA